MRQRKFCCASATAIHASRKELRYENPNTQHRSRQVSISAELMIPSEEERKNYLGRRAADAPPRKTYFLFQAQKLDLPSLRAGQVLSGHIVESNLGDYDAKNVIVRQARLLVNEVHINIPNPFFNEKR